MKVTIKYVFLIVTLISCTIFSKADIVKKDIGSAIIGGITNTATAFGDGIKDTITNSIEAGKKSSNERNNNNNDIDNQTNKGKSSVGEAIVGGIFGGMFNTGKAIFGGIKDTVNEAKKKNKRSTETIVVPIEYIHEYKKKSATTVQPDKKPCQCMCHHEKYFDDLTTTTTAKPKMIKVCQCSCNNEKFFDQPKTTTTTSPLKKSCKCICENDQLFFDESTTTTTVQPVKRKSCKCSCDEEKMYDSVGEANPVDYSNNKKITSTTVTSTPITVTTSISNKTESLKCEKSKKCYSNEDCYKGTCVGAFVGTCNCNACISFLSCKHDSDCGGLIGSCDLINKYCDCQKAYTKIGFYDLIDVLTNFCHKRKCDEKAEMCYGLPCYSGICIC